MHRAAFAGTGPLIAGLFELEKTVRTGTVS
jgi:hypothetical protein